MTIAGMPMAPPLLLLQNVSLTLGGKPLLDDASLSVLPGEKLCVVGRNGSGKSTLLKIAAGLIEPDGGTRFAQPGTRLCYLPQEPELSGQSTTKGYVESALAPGGTPHRAASLLKQVGLSGEAAPERLSGGEARRAALVRALAPEPDVLLLDEPTNHLDLPAIEWLEAELKACRATYVIVSHDQMFLNNLTERTVWLDRGRTRFSGAGFRNLRNGATLCWKKENVPNINSIARSPPRRIGCGMALPLAGNATRSTSKA